MFARADHGLLVDLLVTPWRFPMQPSTRHDDASGVVTPVHPRTEPEKSGDRDAAAPLPTFPYGSLRSTLNSSLRLSSSLWRRRYGIRRYREYDSSQPPPLSTLAQSATRPRPRDIKFSFNLFFSPSSWIPRSFFSPVENSRFLRVIITLKKKNLKSDLNLSLFEDNFLFSLFFHFLLFFHLYYRFLNCIKNMLDYMHF